MENKKELIHLLNNKKIKTNGRSIELQKILFHLGFTLPNGTKEIVYKTMPYIYIENKKISFGIDTDFFHEYPLKELHIHEILKFNETINNIKEVMKEFLHPIFENHYTDKIIDIYIIEIYDEFIEAGDRNIEKAIKYVLFDALIQDNDIY